MKNNKSLGQHWLKNRVILDDIAELAAATTNENTVCFEIGPGLGTLTSSLLKRFSKVIAVEYDAQLAHNLPKSFPGTNLEVIHGDILDINIPELAQSNNYAVVGNIPYYITSPILRQMINLNPSPRRIVLLIQKEVAERITADVGGHSFLSLVVQNRANVTLGPVVKAAEFSPPPKVDSQVVILEPLEESQVSAEIIAFARRGFSNPRKKLSANLASNQITKAGWEKILQQCKINPNARAEDLSLWDWEEIYEAAKTRTHQDSGNSMKTIQKSLAKK